MQRAMNNPRSNLNKLWIQVDDEPLHFYRESLESSNTIQNGENAEGNRSNKSCLI